MGELLIYIYNFLLESIFPPLLASIVSSLLMIFALILVNYKLSMKKFGLIFATFFLLFAISGFDIREQLFSYNDSSQLIVKGKLNNALANKYEAPEILGIDKWFNSSELQIDDLKGKVVLIDFWTYSCINCVRTLPYIKSWHEKYADNGLVIIGVHSPEFAFEKDFENVEKALKKFDIKYPVAIDNDFITWRSYNNRYWPAHYLIDKEGNVVYTHFGEGKYKVTENNIRYLLGLDKDVSSEKSKSFVSRNQTHEIYLGTLRASGEIVDNEELSDHQWRVVGDWHRNPEYIEAMEEGSSLILNYKAKNVYLVIESADDFAKSIEIYNDGEFYKKIEVTKSDIYELVDNGKFSNSVLELRALNKGVRLFAFTFGS